MHLATILGFGFLLGIRHATDADHVVAVSAIVSRARSLRAAAPVGILWGLGHTLTLLFLGGAIIAFDLVIPPRLGLSFELVVALTLVVVGAWSIRAGLRGAARGHEHPHPQLAARSRSLRPLFVGIAHGLAGSAAVVLLTLGTITEPQWGIFYLLVFGVGSVAGMLLVTLALAMPLASVARRFERLHRALGLATALVSMIFGAVLVYQIGFISGLFTDTPHWTPQ